MWRNTGKGKPKSEIKIQTHTWENILQEMTSAQTD